MQQRKQQSSQSMRQGFTLLELSIVLVIIGLIIGGITVGADMIRSAELNSVVSDYQKYQTAVNTFKLKYNALPGDMKNATAYWGEAHATPATCRTTQGTGTQTCDGDGNGKLNVSSGSYETPRFWQHLTNAEIISGSFSGLQGGGGTGLGCDVTTAFENCPKSRIANGYFQAESGVTSTSNTNYTAHKQSHFFIFGSPALANGATNDSPLGAILETTEAHIIDVKIDDGLPAKGRVLALAKKGATLSYLADGKDCSTNADPNISQYDFSRSGKSCSLKILW